MYTAVMIMGIVIPFFLFLVGALFLYWGWNGKKLHDHPYCRKCLYDLHGASDAATCPECGGGLAAPGQVVKGRHLRSKKFVLIGLLLSLSTSMWMGVLGYFYFKYHFNRYHFYPDIWMISTLENEPDLRKASDCWWIVINRQRRGELNASSSHKLVQLILKMQADAKGQWDSRLGALFYELYDNGYVLPEEMQQFQKHIGDGLQIFFRDKCLNDESWPIRLDYSGMRAGYGIHCRIKQLRLVNHSIQIALKPVQTFTSLTLHDGDQTFTSDYCIGILDDEPRRFTTSVTIASDSLAPSPLSSQYDRIKQEFLLNCLMFYYTLRDWFRMDYMGMPLYDQMLDRDSANFYEEHALTCADKRLPVGDYEIVCDVEFECDQDKWVRTYELMFAIVDDTTELTGTFQSESALAIACENALKFVFKLNAENRLAMDCYEFNDLPQKAILVSEVWVEYKGNQFQLGQLNYSSEKGLETHFLGHSLPVDKDLKEIDVILKPDIKRVRQLPVFEAVLGNELHFKAISDETSWQVASPKDYIETDTTFTPPLGLDPVTVPE